MLDDMREVFGAALKSMGKSLNETDPAVLKQAADLLKKQKKLVATYNSGDFANILAAGDVDIAHGYNGQLAEVVAKEPEKLAYVVPKEGATLWMDNVCIPGKARNLENAYTFLNYIMEPQVNAEIVNGVSLRQRQRAGEEVHPAGDPERRLDLSLRRGHRTLRVPRGHRRHDDAARSVLDRDQSAVRCVFIHRKREIP